MGTHDEDTYKFFQNSGVTCVLFPRAGVNEQASLVHRNTTDRIFTHHQKTVCLHAGPSKAPTAQLVALVCGTSLTVVTSASHL